MTLAIPPLRTRRLDLVAATVESMAAAAAQDTGSLGRLLSARVPEDWPPRFEDDGEMARQGFAFVRDVLEKAPELVGWWGWFVILRGPERLLVGTVATKGPPDAEGAIEVAYGIVDSRQRQGFATEATQALLRWALGDPRVRRLAAETLPHLAASISVMRKCGLESVGEGSEPGTIRHEADADRLRRLQAP